MIIDACEQGYGRKDTSGRGQDGSRGLLHGSNPRAGRDFGCDDAGDRGQKRCVDPHLGLFARCCSGWRAGETKPGVTAEGVVENLQDLLLSSCGKGGREERLS